MTSLSRSAFHDRARRCGSKCPRFLPILLILVNLLTLCGCGVISNITELASLRNQLLAEYPGEEINVTVQTDNHLIVSFINSPLNDQQLLQRFERAQRTALFVKRHYPGIDRLENIAVSFLKNEKSWVVVNKTLIIDWFDFGKDGVVVGAPLNYDPQNLLNDEDDLNTFYNPKTNESEIRIRLIQLKGNLENGLALTPHFMVHGDATTAGHSSGIPASVIFDFASYAPEKVFKSDPVFRIVADGNVIFDGRARNRSATDEGGNEFLGQAVPLAQFLKMAEAKTIVLTLGSGEYLLSDGHLRALREMANYATAGRNRKSG